MSIPKLKAEIVSGQETLLSLESKLEALKESCDLTHEAEEDLKRLAKEKKATEKELGGVSGRLEVHGSSSSSSSLSLIYYYI